MIKKALEDTTRDAKPLQKLLGEITQSQAASALLGSTPRRPRGRGVLQHSKLSQRYQRQETNQNFYAVSGDHLVKHHWRFLFVANWPRPNAQPAASAPPQSTGAVRGPGAWLIYRWKGTIDVQPVSCFNRLGIEILVRWLVWGSLNTWCSLICVLSSITRHCSI